MGILREKSLGAWALLVSTTSIVVGVIWDISWHMSIGRDSFWSPPHLAIYLGGIIGGLAGGGEILWTTFKGSSEDQARGVRIWGFHGSLGAFFCAWGALTMLTSAPYDDWWHATYGLDVEILSLPHVILFMGLIMIQLGALLGIKTRENRSPAHGQLMPIRPVARTVLAGGMLVGSLAVLCWQYSRPTVQHSAMFYQFACAFFTLPLVAFARAERERFMAARVALAYMALFLAMLWILPRFPAEAKLGPVWNPVKQMVPLGFPLWLVVPGLVTDLLVTKFRKLPSYGLALVLGAGFLFALMAVQWKFAEFLLSPASRNVVFASHLKPYQLTPDGYWAKNQFVPWEKNLGELAWGLGIALGWGAISAWLGLQWGAWLEKVKR